MNVGIDCRDHRMDGVARKLLQHPMIEIQACHGVYIEKQTTYRIELCLKREQGRMPLTSVTYHVTRQIH